MLDPSKGRAGRGIGEKPRPAFSRERDLQKLCEAYLDSRGLRYIRVPDSLWAFVMTSKAAPVWLKAFASKFLAGMPDLVILAGDRALHVELKAAKGKESEKQKRWAKDCSVRLVKDFDTFMGLVDEFKRSVQTEKLASPTL